MIKIFTLVLFVFTTHYSNCMNDVDSTKTKSRVHYFSYIQAGILTSSAYDHNLSVSSVHGIKIRDKFNVGLGIGYNNYESIRTMPVFVSVARDLAGKENRLFLEVNYGLSIVTKMLDSNWRVDADSSPIFHPAVGYLVKTTGIRISFVAGYIFQRITSQNSNTYTAASSIWPSSYTDTILQMDLSRMVFAVRLGWR